MCATDSRDAGPPAWAEALLLLWAGVILLAPSLGPHPNMFLHGDSMLYAAVAKSTLASGDWLALHLGEEPYFNKPPLLFWLAMLMFKAFGASTWTAQLVGVISGLLLLLATWALGSRLIDRRHGLLAALSLITTYVFLRNASVLRVDAWLALTVLGSLWAVLAAERRPALLPLFWVGAALGVLFKGPAGLISVPVLLVWSLLRRRTWPFSAPAFWSTLPLVPLLILPWVLHNWHLFGSTFLDAYVANAELTVKGLTGAPSYQKYATDLLREGWPWLPFLLHGCWLAGRAILRGERDDRVTLPVAWVLGVMAVLLSLQGAYSRYVIPLLPAASLLTATSLLSIWPRLVVGRRQLVSLGVLLLLCTVVLVFASDLVPGERTPDIVRFQELIRQHDATGRVAVLGRKVPVNLRSAAVFYCDLELDLLPATEIAARLARQPELVAVTPHRVVQVPEDVEAEVLATGLEHDLLLLRLKPYATRDG